MRWCLIRIFFAVVLLSYASTVYGHAILVSATPGVSEVIEGPDVPVKLQFNSRIDTKRSRLVLVAPDGQQRTLPISDQSPPDSLTSVAKGLTGGAYVLRWQVLANDGHITRGEVNFRIRE